MKPLLQILRYKKYQTLTLLENLLSFIKNLWKETKTTTHCLWQRLVYKWLCCVHTSPVWKQDTTKGAQWQTYHGECRVCGKKITQDYRYSDEKGPLLNGIPKDKKGNRDLDRIIQGCLRLFIYHG